LRRLTSWAWAEEERAKSKGGSAKRKRAKGISKISQGSRWVHFLPLPFSGRGDSGRLPSLMLFSICSRLLLRDTVNRSEPPDQISAGNPNHLTARKQGLQGGECPLVVRAGVGGDEHDTVGNVEVGVTGRKPIPFVFHRAGHRQRDHTQGPTVLVGQVLQPHEVVAQERVVHISRIVFHRAYHRRRIDKTRQVVHVAIRVVAHDAVS